MNKTIQFKRGADASRLNVILKNGEPFWSNDTKSLYIGDGQNYGGNPVSLSDNVYTGILNLTGGSQYITGIKLFQPNSFWTNSLLDGDGVSYSKITLTSGQQKFIDGFGDIAIDIVRCNLSGSIDDEVASLDWFNGKLISIYSLSQQTLNFKNSILSGNWQITNNNPPNYYNSSGNIGIISISGNSLCLCNSVNNWMKLPLDSF